MFIKTVNVNLSNQILLFELKWIVCFFPVPCFTNLTLYFYVSFKIYSVIFEKVKKLFLNVEENSIDRIRDAGKVIRYSPWIGLIKIIMSQGALKIAVILHVNIAYENKDATKYVYSIFNTKWENFIKIGLLFLNVSACSRSYFSISPGLNLIQPMAVWCITNK